MQPTLQKYFPCIFMLSDVKNANQYKYKPMRQLLRNEVKARIKPGTKSFIKFQLRRRCVIREKNCEVVTLDLHTLGVIPGKRNDQYKTTRPGNHPQN